MKRVLALTCLVACLFANVACNSSSIDNASLRIRNFWKRLHGQGPTTLDLEPTPAEQVAMDKLPPVPGDELTDEEKLKIVKAQNFFAFRATHKDDTVAVSDSARKLDKLFPTLPRIGEEETMKALLETPVDGIELEKVVYAFQSRTAVSQLSRKQLNPLPGAFFATSDGYYIVYSAYRALENHKMKEILFSVIDRGNYGGILRTAAWYYRRKGFVGQEWAAQEGKYKLTGTKEHDGHLWVIWMLPGSKEKHYSTMWNDRFELWIEGMDDLRVVDQVFNTGWLNAYQEPANYTLQTGADGQ